MKKMKTLSLKGTQYEIVDASARTDIGELKSDLKEIEILQSKNLYNVNSEENKIGKTINTDGTLYGSTNWMVTHSIPVSEGESIYVYAIINEYLPSVESKIAFFNDDAFISYIYQSSGVPDYTGDLHFTVPANANRCIVSSYKTFTLMVAKEKCTSYEGYVYDEKVKLTDKIVKNTNLCLKNEVIIKENYPYKNKKILFIGDSITHYNLEDNGWCKYFNEILEPSKTVNVAVSGATWSDSGDTVYDGNPDTYNQTNNTIGNQVEKILRGKDSTHPNYSHVEDYDDFDIIMIACGTNDGPTKFSTDDIEKTMVDSQWGTTLPLDSVDKKNACGAMRYAYEKLYALYPNARFYYCSPIQTYPSKKIWRETLNKGDVIKEMCRHLPVVFIDTEQCGIYGYREQYSTQGVDLIDGLHPSVSGAKKIGKYNANDVIKSYLADVN